MFPVFIHISPSALLRQISSSCKMQIYIERAREDKASICVYFVHLFVLSFTLIALQKEQAVLLTFTLRNKYEEDISYSIDTLLIPTDPDETVLNEGISMSDFPSFQPARLCSLCKQLKMCIILKTNQSIKLSY